MTSSNFHHSESSQVYRQNASFVYNAANTSPILNLLDAQPTDFILDLGCGSGELTQQLVSKVPQGRVIGVDNSEDMIAAARRGIVDLSEEDQKRLSYDVADGQALSSYLTSHALEGHFDRVFSSAALHWMSKSPRDVITGVHQALKPGGVFVAECGGFMNVMSIRGGCHSILRRYGIDPTKYDPWFFPTAAEYKEMLENRKEAFEVQSCELVPRPTLLTSGLRGWLYTFCGPFFNALPNEEAKNKAVEELEDLLRPDCFDPIKQQWWAMYVRLRVKAIKKSVGTSTAASRDDLHPVVSIDSASTTSSTTPLDPTLLSKFISNPSGSSSSTTAEQTIRSQFLHRTCLVHIPDGRVFKGIFTCTDDGMNLILSQAEEWRLHPATSTSASTTEERKTSSRFVGMVMIKGEDLVRIEVEDEMGRRGEKTKWGMIREEEEEGSSFPSDPAAYA